jgi:hypothetical protein
MELQAFDLYNSAGRKDGDKEWQKEIYRAFELMKNCIFRPHTQWKQARACRRIALT